MKKVRQTAFLAYSDSHYLQALILAHSRPSVYSGFLRNVKGIVFMGTPHRGSGAAYWADFFSRALSAVQLGLRGDNNLLSDLKQNSRTLSDILLQFLEIGASLPIRTFYETRVLGTMMVCRIFHPSI